MKRRSTKRAIRLISLDESPQRGEHVLGEHTTDEGPKLLVVHWRREKREANKEKALHRQENRFIQRKTS